MMRAIPRGRRSAERGGITSKLIALICVVVVCGALYLARYPILRSIGEWWVVDDSLQHSDALVVLSDDNFYADRSQRAAELYRQGMASEVVASGRRLRPYAGIAELMEHDLIERGVPKDKIIRFPQDGDNTKEEAQALLKFVQQKKWRSVIVVTSNYHTRRARYIYEHIFPQDIEVRMAAARDGDFDPERWWEKRKGIKELTREMMGFVVAIWELHGSRPKSGATQSIVGLVRPKPQQVV